MKKNLFYYLFAVICSVALFTSCSDDDDKIVSPVGETTFTDANGLQLTYSGATMLGKKVTFSSSAGNRRWPGKPASSNRCSQCTGSTEICISLECKL